MQFPSIAIHGPEIGRLEARCAIGAECGQSRLMTAGNPRRAGRDQLMARLRLACSGAGVLLRRTKRILGLAGRPRHLDISGLLVVLRRRALPMRAPTIS